MSARETLEALVAQEKALVALNNNGSVDRALYLLRKKLDKLRRNPLANKEKPE